MDPNDPIWTHRLSITCKAASDPNRKVARIIKAKKYNFERPAVFSDLTIKDWWEIFKRILEFPLQKEHEISTVTGRYKILVRPTEDDDVWSLPEPKAVIIKNRTKYKTRTIRSKAQVKIRKKYQRKYKFPGDSFVVRDDIMSQCTCPVNCPIHERPNKQK